MKYGFIKTAAVSPEIEVADCSYNAEAIIANMKRAQAQDVKMLGFSRIMHYRLYLRRPFFAEHTFGRSLTHLEKISAASGEMLVFAGLPVMVMGKIYNCAAAMSNGGCSALFPRALFLITLSFTSSGTLILRLKKI